MAENLENLLKEIFVLDSLVKKLSSQLQLLEKKIEKREADIDQIDSKASKTRTEKAILVTRLLLNLNFFLFFFVY